MSGVAHTYMLDTDIVSDLARNPQGRVAVRLATVGVASVAVSIVVVCEIEYGLARLQRHQQKGKRFIAQTRGVLRRVAKLDFAPPADAHYGDIRAFLEHAGTVIGPNDLLIAAHARALGCTLVTGNVAEFARVPGLAVENWLG